MIPLRSLARYFRLPETSRVHGRFVGEIEDRTLVLTDYSPDPAP
jgi:hypothetical protein